MNAAGEIELSRGTGCASWRLASVAFCVLGGCIGSAPKGSHGELGVFEAETSSSMRTTARAADSGAASPAPGGADAAMPDAALSIQTGRERPDTAATGVTMVGASATPASPAADGGTSDAAKDIPVLPDILGDCPDFTDGSTIMVAGHRGIEIQVGAAGKGGPVLYYWHGTGSSPSEVEMFPATSEIVALGGIVAVFDGTLSSGAGDDCSGTGTHNIADFDAADQIAACGVKHHGIDPRRIYSTGCSSGGLQTGCMAIRRSSYLAAAAPSSGGMVGTQPWQDSHSPAIFTMHGGAADTVIVTFSQTSAALDAYANMHGSFVVNCDHSGGHCGSEPALQNAAWRFMKDHPWGVSPSPWASGIPAGVPDYCEVYSAIR